MKQHKLTAERNDRKWTQEFVAERIGLTVQGYAHIENGIRKPSYEVLCKLEDLFGKSHRELLAQNDETTEAIK